MKACMQTILSAPGTSDAIWAYIVVIGFLLLIVLVIWLVRIVRKRLREKENFVENTEYDKEM